MRRKRKAVSMGVAVAKVQVVTSKTARQLRARLRAADITLAVAGEAINMSESWTSLALRGRRGLTREQASRLRELVRAVVAEREKEEK
jgi:hypothetical protein